jgi:hypothetical protein
MQCTICFERAGCQTVKKSSVFDAYWEALKRGVHSTEILPISSTRM